jgi:hypothetical protein
MLDGPTPERTFHQGVIRQDRRHIEFRNLYLQAILMTFRAMTPEMRSFDVTNYEFTGRQAVIRGTNCLELQQPPFNDLEERIWVDPAQAFLPLRLVMLQRGIITEALDVRYEQNADKEWVPQEWQVILNRSDGRLSTSTIARLTKCELNVAIPIEQFDIEFPAGTYVTDDKNGSRWIVKPDGSGTRKI